MTDPVAIYAEAPAIAEINALEIEADRNEARASDTRWEQAERVVALLADGWTIRDVADSWKRVDGSAYGKSHVGYVAKTWNTFVHLSGRDRPRWNEAYNSPQVRGEEPESSNEAIGTDEYYTPAWIFERLGITFDLDVCAPPLGPVHVPATRWFSEADDGLAQEWSGRVWMNPPYSKPAPWVERFVAHRNGIALVPFAKSGWFFDLWNSPDVLTITAPGIEASKFVGGQIYMPVMLVAVGPVENHDAIRRVGIVR